MIYTLDQLQQSIHKTYDGNVDYYESDDDQYVMRTGFIHDAIEVWENEEGVDWKELFANLSDAADGDKTTIADTTEYDAPSDFIRVSSYVKVSNAGSDIYYTYTSNNSVMSRQQHGDTNYFYVTGNQSTGHKINLSSAPEAGSTISYSYYKTASKPTSTTAKIEMSKPFFVVFYTLARLYELDSRMNLVSYYDQKASSLMGEMYIANEAHPYDGDVMSLGLGV